MTRIKKPTDDFPRTQVSHIPRSVSANTLATTRKLSNAQRRKLHSDRDLLVQIPCTEPKSEQEKYCAKLKRLGIAQLGRNLKRALKRSKTAARILATLDPHSKFYRPMEQQVARQIYHASWVENEIVLRTKPKIVPTALPAVPDIAAEIIAVFEAMTPEERAKLGISNENLYEAKSEL